MRIRNNVRLIKPTLPALAVIGKAGLSVKLEVGNPDELKDAFEVLIGTENKYDYELLYNAFQLHAPLIEHLDLAFKLASEGEERYAQLIHNAVQAIMPIQRKGTQRDAILANELSFNKELFISLFPQASKIRDIELFTIPHHLDEEQILDIAARFLGEDYSALTPQTNVIHLTLLDAVLDNLLYNTDKEHDLVTIKALKKRNRGLLEMKPLDSSVEEIAREEIYVMATNPDILNKEELIRLCSYAYYAEDFNLVSEETINRAFN